MMMTGWGGSILSYLWRQRLLRAASCCLIVAGIVSVARGASYLRAAPGSSIDGCPVCVTAH
jgi:hypothetical protein